MGEPHLDFPLAPGNHAGIGFGDAPRQVPGTLVDGAQDLAGRADMEIASVVDFHVGTDHLTLQGYGGNAAAAALGSATISDGSTFLSLQDGTHITRAGMTNLTASSFV